MISRQSHLSAIQELFSVFPVVCLLGARQTGKSTLARSYPGWAAWYDLEDPRDLARLTEPVSSLEGHRGLVVIDEIQRRPDLFPILRVLADRPQSPARFLVLGSASPGLLRQGAESLAGRVGFHVLPGFDLEEVGFDSWKELWFRGSFPRAFLAPTDAMSHRWRQSFITTFLARDLPALGGTAAPETMRRFWTMLAHRHGDLWNGAELARAFGMGEQSVRRYLDILEGTFVVTVLRPWHENLSKRQVKSPKVYLSDSGLVHSLLGLRTREDLEGHPKVGASWEGFALVQVLRILRAEPGECYFWGTHQGAELDLLVVRGQERLGFEFKRSEAPSGTRSVAIAREDLKLGQVMVIYPGKEVWSLGKGVMAVGIASLAEALKEKGRG